MEVRLGVKNEGGKTILDFSILYDLVITNTCLKKQNDHLITYKTELNFI